MKTQKRKKIIYLNRFQRALLFPILLACLIGLVLCLLLFDYFYFDESSIIYEFSWLHLKLLVKWFLPLAAFSLTIVAGIVTLISHRILGPYERIIRELDQLIDGKPKKLLSVRRKDEMFGDLLKRINTLIKRIPD